MIPLVLQLHGHQVHVCFYDTNYYTFKAFLFSAEESEADTNTMSDQCTCEPLYPGASLSTFHAHLLIMQFALKHSLTKAALTDLIGLLRCIVPPGNNLPTSFYVIKKYFEKRCPEVSKLRSVSYCGTCHHLLECTEPSCPNGCYCNVRHDFLYVPLSPQLERMVKGIVIDLVYLLSVYKINIKYFGV